MNFYWFDYPARNRPRIEMLKGSFSYDTGERFTLVQEDEECIYFEDGFHRSVYLEKSLEGIDFVYVRKGKLPLDK